MNWSLAIDFSSQQLCFDHASMPAKKNFVLHNLETKMLNAKTQILMKNNTIKVND